MRVWENTTTVMENDKDEQGLFQGSSGSQNQNKHEPSLETGSVQAAALSVEREEEATQDFPTCHLVMAQEPWVGVGGVEYSFCFKTQSL